MRGDVSKRLVQGFVANGFGQVVTSVIQLASVPLFLHAWGVRVYGEWLILSAIPAYFAISDIGFATVAGNKMTMQAAAGDRPGANSTFQSTWILIWVLSLTVLLLGAVLIIILPLRSWLHLSTLGRVEVSLTVLILGLYTLAGLQMGLVYAGFRSANDYPLGAVYANLVRLLEFVAAAVALLLGASMVTVAFVFLFARVFLTVLVAGQLTRRHTWLKFGASAADAATLKDLTKPALAFMAFPLGTALSMQGMLTILAALVGPLAVAAFATLRTLSRLGFQVMGVINNAVWVEVSAAYGASDLDLARGLHRGACRLALWLGFVSIILLGVLGSTVYRMWTGGHIEFRASLFYWLLIVVAANGLWYTSSVVLLGTNQHQRMALAYLGGSAGSLVLAYLFVPLYGLNAAAASLLAIDVAMSSYVVRRTLNITEDNLGAFVRSILRPPSLAGFTKTAR